MDLGSEQDIADRFLLDGKITGIQPLGSGLINDTYLVETDSSKRPRFVLQRINGTVFPFPDRIIANLERLARHFAQRSAQIDPAATGERFQLPFLLSSREGQNCHIDESGGYWRALTYIERSRTLDRLESSKDAEQVGYALGCFHNLVANLDAESMQDSLPGFHIAPSYLEYYDRLSVSQARGLPIGKSSDLKYCADFVDARRKYIPVLEKAKRNGNLKLQVIHGDPKLNNILFETTSRSAFAMVDLDTVKPGLIHYDIGDCLRSCCNRACESIESPDDAIFDLDICEAILLRYFQERRASLSRSDIDYLYDAVYLLPFELGLRFLSDYLDGDRYFKVDNPRQNLSRALIQFTLVRSVEKQERGLRQLIRKAALHLSRSKTSG